MDHDTGILPLPERMGNIEVLIRKIITARECHLSVDDRHLAVIPVIHEHIKEQEQLIEHAAMDPIRLHAVHKVCVDKADTSHIVVEKTYFNTRGCPLFEDLMHPGKCLGVLDRKVFHKNEMLCLPKLLLLPLERIRSFREKFHIGIVICGKSGNILQISELVAYRQILFTELIHDLMPVREKRLYYLFAPAETALHRLMRTGHADFQIEDQSQKGKGKDQHDPGHLHR